MSKWSSLRVVLVWFICILFIFLQFDLSFLIFLASTFLCPWMVKVKGKKKENQDIRILILFFPLRILILGHTVNTLQHPSI